MNPSEFVKKSLETESQIDALYLDPSNFRTAQQVALAAGELLDQIKKNTFYGREFKQDKVTDSIATIVQQSANLDAATFMSGPNRHLVNINPRLFHSILGIVTEGVELLDAIDVDSGKLDRVNVLEELGDVLWYIAIALDEAGSDFETVFDTIIAKLAARNKNKGKFDAEATINRDVDAERQILEAGFSK